MQFLWMFKRLSVLRLLFKLDVQTTSHFDLVILGLFFPDLRGFKKLCLDALGRICCSWGRD